MNDELKIFLDYKNTNILYANVEDSLTKFEIDNNCKYIFVYYPDPIYEKDEWNEFKIINTSYLLFDSVEDKTAYMLEFG